MPFRAIDPQSVPPQHPVACLRDAWPAMCGPDGIVSWSSFDPLDIPQVLPWVLLLRQDDPVDPARLSYVICGEGCRQTFGFSYQGKTFGEDLPPSAVARRLQEFATVRAGGGPLYSETPLPVPGRDFIEVYRGVFGLSTDGEWVDRILIVIAPVSIRLPARSSPSSATPGTADAPAPASPRRTG